MHGESRRGVIEGDREIEEKKRGAEGNYGRSRGRKGGGDSQRQTKGVKVSPLAQKSGEGKGAGPVLLSRPIGRAPLRHGLISPDSFTELRLCRRFVSLNQSRS